VTRKSAQANMGKRLTVAPVLQARALLACDIIFTSHKLNGKVRLPLLVEFGRVVPSIDGVADDFGFPGTRDAVRQWKLKPHFAVGKVRHLRRSRSFRLVVREMTF
jgi:hypothetical protein